MSRHALSLNELIHPKDPTAQPPPEAEPVPVQQEVKTEGPVTFVKNLHPRERIRFADGTRFNWPGQVFIATEPELIAKIREVSKVHHISER
jgi:hypothetical protein